MSPQAQYPAAVWDRFRTPRHAESFLCYLPEQESPVAGPLPAERIGHVTFGSFNNFAKVSTETADLWSQIMDSVPNSRLILKAKCFSDEQTRQYAKEIFSERNIDSDRIHLLPWESTPHAHLVLYPINPQMAAKFRKAFYPSGSKTDPLDADLLLQILLQHRHHLKAWEPDEPLTRQLQLLVEARRRFVADRVRLSNRLEHALKATFPRNSNWPTCSARTRGPVLNSNICRPWDYNIEVYGLRGEGVDTQDSEGADTVQRGGVRWA